MAAAVNVAQGKVVSLTGKVLAIAADGSQRILKLGDIVATGERLVVPADGAIELQGSNGFIVKIAEARDLTITDDVFGLQGTDATDAAIAALNPKITSGPNSTSTINGSEIETLVMTVRDNVSLTERFKSDAISILRNFIRFSRIRSYTTTVSFNE